MQDYKTKLVEMIDSGKFEQPALELLNSWLIRLDTYHTAEMLIGIDQVKKIISDFNVMNGKDDEFLKNQVLMDNNDMMERHRIQALKKARTDLLSYFTLEGKDELEKQINTQYDYYTREKQNA